MDRVELETVELSDPSSVGRFEAGFLASGRPLHLLFNNAGIMAVPFAKNARGFILGESALAVDATSVYWTSQDACAGSCGGAILKLTPR
jgi:NAD(P)-dependent dehydrogenase (short-subunit alcohol dehydrogenase family)